jgi:hypothetical protein
MTRVVAFRRSLLACASVAVFAAGVAQAGECKSIHADLVELRVTEGCNAGEPSCFLGVVDGNHGLRGTTHFRADGFLGSIPTSPGSTPYSGPFEYRLGTGTLLMRETGVTVPGVVTAHHRIVEGTGEFAGATGDFFVSGTREGTLITTNITGTLCLP